MGKVEANSAVRKVKVVFLAMAMKEEEIRVLGAMEDKMELVLKVLVVEEVVDFEDVVVKVWVKKVEKGSREVGVESLPKVQEVEDKGDLKVLVNLAKVKAVENEEMDTMAD